MRVINRRKLSDFYRDHADAEKPLNTWYEQVKKAEWKNPIELRQQYGSASIIGNNRVVFNIKGNTYRLVVEINYTIGNGVVYVRYVGTHAEYNKVNAKEV